MVEAALKVARVAGYRNAGTMEFLVDGGEFYFLEANTRLQVEHPVTEMRFGCDLVAEQLRVAMGERVSEPAAPRGVAIECRIYAEDAEHNFRPATGEALYLNLPAGPGVRIDTHLVTGARVTAFYDGLLGKLICWGADREQARGRMAAALGRILAARRHQHGGLPARRHRERGVSRRAALDAISGGVFSAMESGGRGAREPAGRGRDGCGRGARRGAVGVVGLVLVAWRAQRRRAFGAWRALAVGGARGLRAVGARRTMR